MYYARIGNTDISHLIIDGKLIIKRLGIDGSLVTNATTIDCDNNNLTSLVAPNATYIYCKNNQLTSLVDNCGHEKRSIFSQKVNNIIYTYIGCSRVTLEEAIKAIRNKYSGGKAEEYINKVVLSQSLINKI